MLSLLPPSSLRLLGAGIGRRYVWCGGGEKEEEEKEEEEEEEEEKEEEDAARAFGCSHVQYISAGGGEWRKDKDDVVALFPHILFSHVYALCFENSHCRCAPSPTQKTQFSFPYSNRRSCMLLPVSSV